MSANTPERLEAYLDGRLAAAAQAEFRRELAAKPALQAEILQQRRIDEALRRNFAPPAADAAWAAVLTARGGNAHAPATPASIPQLANPASAKPSDVKRAARKQSETIKLFSPAGMAIAALLAFVSITSLWITWNKAFVPGTTSPYPTASAPFLTLAAAYQSELQRGFKPLWLCRNEQELAGTVFKYMDQGLLWANVPQHVSLLGLSISKTLSPRTVVMLAKVNGREVALFIDRKANDKPPQIDPSSGLRAFRGEVGELVLYEVTPLDKPALLELAYDPQKPADWYRVGAW